VVLQQLNDVASWFLGHSVFTRLNDDNDSPSYLFIWALLRPVVEFQAVDFVVAGAAQRASVP